MVAQEAGNGIRVVAPTSERAGNDRAGMMKRSYSFYVGNPPAPLVRRSGEPDDNVLISLGRSLVDTGVAYLFGEDVPSTIAGEKAERPQDWLDECWRRNKRALTLQKLAQNGAVCGHVFVKIIPQGIRTGAGAANWPRIVVLDPQTVNVVTDDDDCDLVEQYIITLPKRDEEGDSRAAGGDPRRQVIDRVSDGDGNTTGWLLHDQRWVGGAWVTDLTTSWEWDFAPIVDCQNLPRPNDFWGEADLPDDVCSLLAQINRLASHHQKIVRVHAHPKTWARGMGTRTLDLSIDSVIQMPSETAELRILEMQSDLSSTREFLTQLSEYFAIVTRTPLVAMGVPDRQGAISGVALQIRFRPLVQKTEAKRRTYGDLIVELDRRLLAIGGFGDGILTQLDWPELLPSDPLAERQTLVLDDGLGIVSKETLATKLGYDWETEQANKDKERAAAPPLPAMSVVPGQAAVDPAQPVPPPAAFQPPKPDIAGRATSR
jgi:hypothetical protein